MNELQTEFAASGAADSQNARVLDHLKLYQGSWVDLPKLVHVGGGYAVHSRISDLRKAGHAIENRVDRSAKPYRSFYRLNS